MPACPHCGAANPLHARFCSACGAQLIAQTSELDLSSRKVVTILFSDLAGSTGLGERHDPEALRYLIGRYFESMRRVLERHGGTVEKFIGDAIMAVFGHPVTHEDDALRAVRAAAEMRVALAVLNERLADDGHAPLEARIGINTGEVVAGEPSFGHGFVTGDVVNTAKRLEEEAASGEILVGEGTLHLVRDAVRSEVVDGLALRGKRLPTSAFRVVEVSTEAPGVARRLDVPIVNRESELNALQALFDKVVTRARCSLVLVLGAAGIGKNRLAKEFAASLGEEVSVLRGRCVSYSEGVTFSPVVDVVKEALALTDADRPEQAREKVFRLISDQDDGDRVYERLSGVLGLGGAELPAQEIFWAVRRLLEALAVRRPVVVVFDDVHWGEPTFLDLLEYLAGRSQGFPILLCCLARPELLESRPSLSATDGGAEHIRLEALREEETRELVAQFLDTGEVAEEVHLHVAAAAEGNPLFLEELLQMLIDDRHLRREGGEWRTSARLLGVRLPPTIQALLAARLDRLDGGERAVIERAAVIGPVFHWSAVAELAPASLVERLATHLQALVRRDFVRPVESEFAGEDAFAFSHGLMRDTAYVSIPKEVRAELHSRYAAWLERKIAGIAGEYEELVAYHLEQSVRYRRELGRIDERTGEVAVRAGMLLSLAGKRALARGDAPAAGNLLERAAWLLTDRPERPQVLLELTVALRDLGELVRAEALVDEAAAAARVEGNVQLEARAHLERAVLRIYTKSGGAGDDLLRLVDRTIPVLEQAGDDEGLAKAWYLVGAVHWTRCHAREMEQVLDRALAHARRADSQRELAFVLNALARAVVAGPTPVDVALTRCTNIVEQAAGDRTQQAIVLTWVAMLEAMRGNVDYARSLCADSQAILEELGQKLRATALQGYVGAIELLAGNPLAAEHLFRSALDALEPLGERPNMRAISARLAEALSELGRDEEAERFARASRETAPLDDLVTQVHGRTALATILARRGEHGEAEALCREAVSLADETDWLNMRGDAYTCLAGVLASAGNVDAAHTAAQAAARLYELKGNLVSARRAQTAAGSRTRQPDLI
jgi:predicted ATPase/class 3 adenylate cyclase